jgi:cytochrome-b5 reductase
MCPSLNEWMIFKESIPRRWPLRDISKTEVARHCTPDDVWVILSGLVFDVTPYLRFHPGGADVLMEYAGCDITIVFRENHAWVNWESLLDRCIVGRVVPG